MKLLRDVEMPYFLFNWSVRAEQHIDQHAVTREEFEEVMMDPDRVDISLSSGNLIAFGPTSTGKYLACVYDEFEDWIYPITAYEV